MSEAPVAIRYAQALFELSKADGAIGETLEQVVPLGRIVHDEPLLRQLILNPKLDAEEKAMLLERTLSGGWSNLVRAFVRVVISADRAELFPEIAEALQAALDVERKTLRVVVRSSHPLSQPTIDRLQRLLERRENRRVILTGEIDTALLGGFQLLLDHRVIDGSVRQILDGLRGQLMAVRVH